MSYFAYLDPATGSLVAQAVIGVVASVGYFFRHYIWQILGKITGKSKKQ